ncbi:hypothetical protein I203_104857 [Kwoniella mangroviensis CBS 8507]|uniref:uncharacterized protein n=1 Tax=Kwoniella mangroviensis CBS 8507 TaxID=1296122 RepID=UPI00080D21DF|nr:uncharacterized protein I203_00201 [Kwoniella mangroviensis CBS 8507]OCF70070.1 hypothetical protein I203_00201 [Kwoniella mangroviensis CBS 8507]
MITRTAILSSLLFASGAFAHCQLAWPFPLHSPLNPATPEAIKDYSNTSPLITDGTYPCKGFINNPSSDMGSVATFSAGSSMNYTIAGTATHGGGSCQISMSYDQGSTWNVIYSQVGGCLVDGMTTTITIPSEAPNGDALFAWGWFNRQGNREMYHNCASVTITNGGSGLNSNDYPTPFVANANVNQCKTIEGIDVVFPNPGKNVNYGGSYASTKPTTPAGFTGSNCVGPGATESSPSSASASASTTSSSQGVAVSASIGVQVGNGQSTSASAVAAQPSTTEYSLSLDPTTTSLTGINNNNAAQPSTSATTSTCKRRKRRSNSDSVERRHQRLIRRPRANQATGRVAASKAEHVNRQKKRGTGRVAAMKATHNV